MLVPLVAAALVFGAPASSCVGTAPGCKLPTPPPETGPAVKKLERDLRNAATTKRLKAGRLRARFAAPTAGTLTVRWTDAKGPIAKAHHTFATKGAATITMRLTRHGRSVLRTEIRGFLTHTEFKLKNGSILAGSALDGEVTVRD